jgi:uncharacterized protein
MKIDITKIEDIKSRWHPFAHTYRSEELEPVDENVRFLEMPEIEGQLREKEGSLTVEGRLKAKVETVCDRCLMPLTFPVDTDFNYKFVTTADYTSIKSSALQEEDLDLSTFDGISIDVDSIVNEQVTLALPSRLLCQEDCKGFCAVCGKDLNNDTCSCNEKEIDPRWEALKRLK